MPLAVLFIMAILGFLVAFIVFFMITAIFTLIFGKLLGYKFLYFVFLCFNIKKENGRLKLDICNMQLAAQCGMYKENCSNTDTVLYNMLPELAELMLVPLLNNLCMADGILPIWRNVFYGYCFFLLWNGVLIAILINKCYSSSTKAVMWRKTNDLTNRLSVGTRPGDLPIAEVEIPDKKIDVNELRYYLFLYYHYLEICDYAKMKAIANLFEVNMPNTHAHYYICYIYELIFYYSYIDFDLNKAQEFFSYVDSELTSDKDINGRRVYAYYLFYTNKGKDKALKAAKEGIAVADKYPHKGIAVMEQELLTQLITDIGEDA